MMPRHKKSERKKREEQKIAKRKKRETAKSSSHSEKKMHLLQDTERDTDNDAPLDHAECVLTFPSDCLNISEHKMTSSSTTSASDNMNISEHKMTSSSTTSASDNMNISEHKMTSSSTTSPSDNINISEHKMTSSSTTAAASGNMNISEHKMISSSTTAASDNMNISEHKMTSSSTTAAASGNMNISEHKMISSSTTSASDNMNISEHKMTSSSTTSASDNMNISEHKMTSSSTTAASDNMNICQHKMTSSSTTAAASDNMNISEHKMISSSTTSASDNMNISEHKMTSSSTTSASDNMNISEHKMTSSSTTAASDNMNISEHEMTSSSTTAAASDNMNISEHKMISSSTTSASDNINISEHKMTSSSTTAASDNMNISEHEMTSSSTTAAASDNMNISEHKMISSSTTSASDNINISEHKMTSSSTTAASDNMNISEHEMTSSSTTAAASDNMNISEHKMISSSTTSASDNINISEHKMTSSSTTSASDNMNISEHEMTSSSTTAASDNMNISEHEMTSSSTTAASDNMNISEHEMTSSSTAAASDNMNISEHEMTSSSTAAASDNMNISEHEMTSSSTTAASDNMNISEHEMTSSSTAAASDNMNISEHEMTSSSTTAASDNMNISEHEMTSSSTTLASDHMNISEHNMTRFSTSSQSYVLNIGEHKMTRSSKTSPHDELNISKHKMTRSSTTSPCHELNISEHKITRLSATFTHDECNISKHKMTRSSTTSPCDDLNISEHKRTRSSTTLLCRELNITDGLNIGEHKRTRSSGTSPCEDLNISESKMTRSSTTFPRDDLIICGHKMIRSSETSPSDALNISKHKMTRSVTSSDDMNITDQQMTRSSTRQKQSMVNVCEETDSVSSIELYGRKELKLDKSDDFNVHYEGTRSMTEPVLHRRKRKKNDESDNFVNRKCKMTKPSINEKQSMVNICEQSNLETDNVPYAQKEISVDESHNVNISENKLSRLEKRRIAYRKKYQEDKNFREHKKTAVRKRYHGTVQTAKKEASKHKYATNFEHQTTVKEASIHKYVTNLDHQTTVKEASIHKYATNLDHQTAVKETSIHKYATNLDHQTAVKEASIHKYATNLDHQTAVKEASIHKYATNVEHQTAVKETSIHKYATNLDHQTAVKETSIHKYATNLDHQTAVKEASIHKYATNVEHQTAVKETSIHKYATNVEHQTAVKHASKRKYSTDPQLKHRLIQSKKAKYNTDDDFRDRIVHHERLLYEINSTKRRAQLDKHHDAYVTNPELRQQKIQSVREKRNVCQDEETVISSFKTEINEKPTYVCCVCHKLLWHHQCIICHPEDYMQKSSDSGYMATHCITTKYLHTCNDLCTDYCKHAASSRGKLWICFTCHRKLLKGQMPPDAQRNNLELSPAPKEVNGLNDVERHLIALRIPFMKMVSLPKGGQKGIIGPCVSVPTEVQKTTKTLPRCDSEAELIRVKLKRKLPYKGHYKYHFVSTKKLKTAIDYLKSNNHWYKDVTLDPSWENPVIDMKHTDDSVADSDNDDNDECDQTEVDVKSDLERKSSAEQITEVDSDKMQGVPVDTFLQPSDIAQEILDQYFDDIFCIAPAENNTPVSLLTENGNEAMSFPCLFPSGTASFSDDRKVPITHLRYFHNRLMNADGRFARDTAYIFYAQYVAELQQVISNVSIALRKGTASDQHGTPITSGMISDRTTLKNLLKSDQGYKFLKPIRGTPPYWQTTMKDLFAMIRQKGIPTWFCTFSSADMRWPEIINTILEQDNSTLTFEDLDWTQKCEVLSSNPVMSSLMFNHKFNTFLKKVILSGLQPIGAVDNRFHRIEFQKRGSPHSHCTFWIKDSPKLDTDDDETICEFIDKYVTCHLPSNEEDSELHEIVSSVQQHSKSHSKSCQKKGTTCRFHFPRPPSERTYISRPISLTDPTSDKSPEQEINEAKEILKLLWDIILDPNLDASDITTENLFQQAGITQEQFEHASNIMTKRSSIVLQRSPADVWINQYNSILLKCWDANMDIQYILDAYSCVMYIISYISKAETELGMILEETRKEAAEGNLDAEQAMKQIGSSYFRNREVCVQEAVYRVCGLHLKESSCKVQFIPVGENPVKMSIPLHIIQARSKQKDVDDIWMTSLCDKYKARPNNSRFDCICYASFCSKFRILSPSQIPKNPCSSIYYLQNNMGCIQERTKSQPAVVRYPRFSVDKHAEQYYQSILQLFLPHRTDKQLKPAPYRTYEEFYQCGSVKLSSSSSVVSVSSVVDENRSLFEKNAEVLDDAKQMMEKVGPQEDAWATLASETERERIECDMEMKKSDATDEYSSDSAIPDLSTQKQHGALEMTTNIYKRQDILPLLQCMNDIQKEVFYSVRKWCLDKVNGKNPSPFHLFITGGAGTGKSHLIKCLYYEVQKLLSPLSTSPDDIVALLTAPTGTAAFNIGGTTIHSAFSLSKYLTLPYKALRDDNINTLRATLQHLQVLFIDEISMVDKKVFIYVSERLRQIKLSKSSSVPFGGVSVIAVGDFYQLPPVKQASLLKKDPKDPLNFFTDYFELVELREVMRQKDDEEFACMLNRLRVRKKGEPLNPDDLSRLQECENRYTENEALHVYPTNLEVDDHNFHMAQKVCSIAMNIIAHDFKKDLTTGKQERVDTNYNAKQGNLPSELFIGRDARVMLIRNIDVTDGLVNGVFGTVQKILPPKDENSLHAGVLIKFDNPTVGARLRKSNQTYQQSDTSVLITPISEELGGRSKIRHQFPLQPAWACTVHKVQGVTTDAITTSLGKVFSPGQAYVALSRCTSLNGLMIKDLNVDSIYCDTNVALAMSKMKHFPLQTNDIAPPGSVSIILHNIQGLLPHLEDLKANKSIHKCDYLCLTETWLTENNNKPSLLDYKLQHKPRSTAYDSSSHLSASLKEQSHGGVGIFYKSSYVFNEVDLGITNLEYLAFQILILDVTVIVIYRPQTYVTSQFLDNLKMLIEAVQHKNLTAIILGDFNENSLSLPCPIKSFLHKFGYAQIVSEPTTDGDTLIDHVYSDNSIQLDIKIIPTYYSYHNMISLHLSKQKLK